MILTSKMFHPCYNHYAPCVLQYPLYTVMVFNDWRNDIHVVFFVISRTCEQDLRLVLQALHHMVQTVNSAWNPSSIIIDNAQAEINTWGKFFFYVLHSLNMYCQVIKYVPYHLLHLTPSYLYIFAAWCGHKPKFSCVCGMSGRHGQRMQ